MSDTSSIRPATALGSAGGSQPGSATGTTTGKSAGASSSNGLNGSTRPPAGAVRPQTGPLPPASIPRTVRRRGSGGSSAPPDLAILASSSASFSSNHTSQSAIICNAILKSGVPIVIIFPPSESQSAGRLAPTGAPAWNPRRPKFLRRPCAPGLPPCLSPHCLVSPCHPPGHSESARLAATNR